MEKRIPFLAVLRIILMSLIVLSLFVFVFLDSVISNSFSMRYCKLQYEKNEVYPVFAAENYTKDDINGITSSLFNYLKGRGELEGDFFNEEEKSHLVDVKELFSKGFMLYYASLILFAALLAPFFIISRKQKRFSTDFSIITLTAGGMILIALFIPLFFSFESFFMKFHEIFFIDNYLFPSTYNLIRLFPLQFFRSITKRIFMHTMIKSLALIVAGLVPIFFKLQEKQIKFDKSQSLKFGMRKR